MAENISDDTQRLIQCMCCMGEFEGFILVIVVNVFADPGADGRDSQRWNPMEEDYLSERNTYHIDVDDPGVATVGYSKLFSRGFDCTRWLKCNRQNTRVRQIATFIY